MGDRGQGLKIDFSQSFSLRCIVFSLANSTGYIPFKQFCNISHLRGGGLKIKKISVIFGHVYFLLDAYDFFYAIKQDHQVP